MGGVAFSLTSRDYKAPPIIVIEGNGTRESHQGIRWKESEIMYTLNSTEVHAVFDARGNGGGTSRPPSQEIIKAE